VGGRVVSDDARQVKALSGWNCTLKCTAEYKPGVQYSAVSWYKVKTVLFKSDFMKVAASGS